MNQTYHNTRKIHTQTIPTRWQWMTDPTRIVTGQVKLGPKQEFGIYMPYKHPLDHCLYLDCICLGMRTPKHNIDIQGHPEIVTMLNHRLGGFVTAWSGECWNQRILIAIKPNPQLLDFVLEYQNRVWSDGYLYADLAQCQADSEYSYRIRPTEYDLYRQVLYISARRIDNLKITTPEP